MIDCLSCPSYIFQSIQLMYVGRICAEFRRWKIERKKTQKNTSFELQIRANNPSNADCFEGFMDDDHDTTRRWWWFRFGLFLVEYALWFSQSFQSAIRTISNSAHISLKPKESSLFVSYISYVTTISIHHIWPNDCVAFECRTKNEKKLYAELDFGTVKWEIGIRRYWIGMYFLLLHDTLGRDLIELIGHIFVCLFLFAWFTAHNQFFCVCFVC